MQAVLGGIDNIKIGFVSRKHFKKIDEHSILEMRSYKLNDFCNALNLNTGNCWGIAKYLFDLLVKQENGRYLLVKDP